MKNVGSMIEIQSLAIGRMKTIAMVATLLTRTQMSDSVDA